VVLAQWRIWLMGVVQMVTRWSQRASGVVVATGTRAQGLVEYAVIIALVAVIALASVQGFGNGIVSFFGRLLARFQGLG